MTPGAVGRLPTLGNKRFLEGGEASLRTTLKPWSKRDTQNIGFSQTTSTTYYQETCKLTTCKLLWWSKNLGSSTKAQLAHVHVDWDAWVETTQVLYYVLAITEALVEWKQWSALHKQTIHTKSGHLGACWRIKGGSLNAWEHSLNSEPCGVGTGALVLTLYLTVPYHM